jgi:DNA-binding NtrC family response regulator
METPKILVVDDEKSICQNVEKILKKNNYEVVHANSAQEALERMAKDSFALMISDIVMPKKKRFRTAQVGQKRVAIDQGLDDDRLRLHGYGHESHPSRCLGLHS